MSNIESGIRQYTIDNDLRNISIPTGKELLGVAGDICVNKVLFLVPRYVNGVDMSGFTPYVDYVNANGNGNYFAGTDINIGIDQMTFVWELQSDVTAYSGNVTLAVRFLKLSGSDIVGCLKTKTVVARVASGLDVLEPVTPEEQQDILAHIEEEAIAAIQKQLTEITESGKDQITQHAIAKTTEIELAADKKKDSVLEVISEDKYIKELEETNNKIDQLGGELDKFSYITKGINLYNPNDPNITKNASISSKGEVIISSEWNSEVTDFIEVAVENRILRSTSELNYEVAEYKEDKTYIKTTTINKDTPITLDDTTKKIRIKLWKSKTMFYLSDTVLPYEDYYEETLLLDKSIPNTIARTSMIESIQTEVNSVKQKYEMTNYMLFAEEYDQKKYIDGVLKDTKYWKASSLLEIDKDYDMYSPAVNGIASFFNINKQYISDLVLQYGHPIIKEEYPEKAQYVAFSYQQNYMQSYENKMYIIRTNNYGIRTRKFYPMSKKTKDKRLIINIYTTDSQDTILWKLADAFLTRDCNVYFEYGTYVFDEIWVDLYEKYNYREYYELPIGGNCRYYFNGSTLVCNVDKMIEKGYKGTIDLLSCLESNTSESYELYDGTLINNGGIYVVHDECGGKPNWYSHKYKNMHFIYNSLSQTNNIRKCIGGGTGLYGESVFESCIFETDHEHDISFHGIASDREEESDFNLKITNCYLSKNISLDLLAKNQTANAIITGCSAGNYLPSTGKTNKWKVTTWNSGIRTE